MVPRRALAMSRPNLGPKKKKKKAGGAGKVVEVKLPDPETVKKTFVDRQNSNKSRIIILF